jgi:hypothetical protein
MIGNIVIGVPSSMKLYLISETELEVVSTLLRVHVVRSRLLCPDWSEASPQLEQSEDLLFLQLFQNLHGRISAYLEIRLALFRNKVRSSSCVYIR